MKDELFDPTILAGLAQSLAAVMAVLFGWGLSALTERRSWKRRKVEQIRDRQLTILSQVVLDLRTALDIADDVAAIAQEIVLIEKRPAEDKAASLLRREADHRLNELRKGLFTVCAQLEAQEMALRLIGYGESGLAAIRSALAPLQGMVRGSDRASDKRLVNASELLMQGNQLRLGVASFLDQGAEGLSA